MFDSFTTQLKTFAMSVDAIDDPMLDQVGRALYDYMTKGINTCYHEIAVHEPNFEQGSDGARDQALQIRFCRYRRRIGQFARLTSEDGAIRSQKAYAFLRSKRLWLCVSSPDDLLRGCAPEDVAVTPADLADLPAYRCYEDDRDGLAKTAVMMPLTYQDRAIGVATIEFASLIEHSRQAREQLQTICDSIARICGRYLDTRSTKADTQRAFGEIMSSVKFEECDLLPAKPLVFLSYPKAADGAVVGLIKEVLDSDKFCGQIAVYDWESDANHGTISSHIVDQIRNSRFGICYFSERRDDGSFADNANVLFEAGMFHVLRGNTGSHLDGWLPIREDAAVAGDLPFNFAGDRVVIVPRGGDGVNRQSFVDQLERHLSRLFGIT